MLRKLSMAVMKNLAASKRMRQLSMKIKMRKFKILRKMRQLKKKNHKHQIIGDLMK
jgi:hypothetical protein